MPIVLAAILLAGALQDADKLEKIWAVDAPFPVQSVAISPDGKVLVVGGYTTCHDIILVDPSNGMVRKTWPIPKGTAKDEAVTGIGFTADPNLFLTGGTDGFVRQWDIRSGRQVKSRNLTTPEETGRILDLVTSPDGKVCAAALQERIVVLKSAGLEEIVRLAGYPYPGTVNGVVRSGGAHGLSFTADGSKLATAGNEGVLKVWDVKTGKELLSINAKAEVRPYAMALSADGKLLASGGPNMETRVWEVATGKQRMAGSHAPNHPNGFWFNSTGSTLLTGDSKTAIVWEVATGKELCRLDTEIGGDASTLSRDGTLLVLGNIPSRKLSAYRWTGPKTATQDKK
jgi:WD40 repeat protein